MHSFHHLNRKDNETETEVIPPKHSGGYPDNPGTSAAQPGGLSRGDCVTIRGFRQALCWAFRTDNSGPPEDLTEVLFDFELTRTQFPGAVVVASTFDNFINELIPFKSNLPVFTEEIGDVWLQGIASDPYKMAQYRTITRARAECIASGKCDIDDPVMKNMSRWLIKPPEHTWGLPNVGDGQTSLWSNSQFEKSRNQQIYLNCESAWIEQRNFNNLAVDTLVEAKHPLADVVLEQLAALEPQRPSTAGYTQITDFAAQHTCFGSVIMFDKSGAIMNLTDQSNESWASATSLLGKLVYTTWDESGYNSTLPCNLVLGGKPGSNEAHPVNSDWETSVVSMWQYSSGGQSCSFLVQVAMDNETVANYGGFPEAWITYNISSSAEQLAVNIDYQWFSKTSTRLAESFMLDFTPPQKWGYSWQMNKLGSSVSPTEVMQGGSQSQHGVWEGVAYVPATSSGKTFKVLTSDVPLVSPITTTMSATPLVNSVEPLSGEVLGFGFNLFNNVWDTNYLLWYPLLTAEGKDQRLRFQMVIE
eukprot:Phypoly_transcript_02024.p1 GENE.Phypoly_transcript_02024~~Phypoly_transcript_02024.p1  ORF type:complete len:530 (+),score=58.15 Phypoly_transcript_02024:1219-2808(+)